MAERATPVAEAVARGRDAARRVHDVLVVGGGPSGAACAYWLADAGWDVVLVEKKRFPREKTCGDGLTPRSVRQLADMGLAGALSGAHRYDGLRACAYGLTLELPWPQHPAFPAVGYVITRHDLDQVVAERAAKAGAAVWEGSEAVAPILDRGTAGPAPGAGAPRLSLPACEGARVLDRDTKVTHEVRARYVVVADGANSRFGRALGTTRDRRYPMGMALRGYFRSPRHEDPFIESHLDIRDASGEVVPGYGWIFPLGDGRVNAGVGILTVEGRWKGVNTSRLMDAFVDWAPASWGLSADTLCGPPTGGKLPMGLSVGPRVGPNVLAIGDAAGSINPFNGEGIAYGYETGRLAAACLGRALAGEGHDALADYERQLQDAYALYYKVARQFVKMISRPELMRACVRTGMHSRTIMDWLLRIMANLVRPDELGPAEAAYRALLALARVAPD
ncbi:MAG TPA: geranylgeranyl reductase family protein [Acidimicrobiales bacterium]|nr:geranylgeranyl reductase family protein [Acidimicrobiales bacterium]